MASIALAAVVMAAPSECGDLCSAQAIELFGEMLASAEFGRPGALEKAGFLVIRDGALKTVAWSSGGYYHATFRGSVPKDCIAIVHTHPQLSPDPSKNDVAVARKAGLPVLVLTTIGVTVAEPDGSRRRLIRGVGWWTSRYPERSEGSLVARR